MSANTKQVKRTAKTGRNDLPKKSENERKRCKTVIRQPRWVQESSEMIAVPLVACSPPERSSGEVSGLSVSKDWRKTQRNFGESFCRFSSFNFQGKGPQNISRKFLPVSGPQIPQGLNQNSFHCDTLGVSRPKVLQGRHRGGGNLTSFSLFSRPFL